MLHNLQAYPLLGVQVDPQLDVHALRSLALTAFEAFKNCLPNKGEEFNRESPGSLGDELFEWQSRWPDAASSPCNGGNPGQNSAQLEREWRTAFSAYVGSDEHDRMLRAGNPLTQVVDVLPCFSIAIILSSPAGMCITVQRLGPLGAWGWGCWLGHNLVGCNIDVHSFEILSTSAS